MTDLRLNFWIGFFGILFCMGLQATPALQLETTQTLSLVSSSLKVGRGISDVSIAKIQFKTNSSNVSLQTLTLTNPYNTFSTSSGDESGIKHIKIYADANNNGQYDGSADTLVVDQDLNGSTSQITLTLSSSILLDQTSGSNYVKNFFVLYTVGNTFPLNTKAGIGVSAATAQQASPLTSISLTGNAYVIPSAEFTVVDASLRLENVTEISPVANKGVMQGQMGVPLLQLTLSNLTASNISGASFKFTNTKGSLSPRADGVNRLYLYYKQTSPVQDILVSTLSQFSNSTDATFTGIQIPTGFNQVYYLTADIGQMMSTNTALSTSKLAFQFANIDIGSSVFTGVVPQPVLPNSLQVSPHSLEILRVSSATNALDSSSTGVIVNIGIKNNSSQTVTAAQISEISPQFYLTDISGINITSQFAYPVAVPANIPAGATVTFSATISGASLTSTGVVIGDGFIEYQDPLSNGSNQKVRLNRYLGAGNVYNPAATQTNGYQVWTVQNVNTAAFSAFPEYITSMNVKYPGGSYLPFLDGDYIQSQSELLISFANQAQNLDLSSLQLYLNGSSISSYSFPSTGVLKISSLGTSSGTLQIKVNDKNGMAQTPSTVRFFIGNGSLKLSSALAGPSPYNSATGGDLRIDFQSSVAGTKVYGIVYDFQGRTLWKNYLYTSLGHNQFVIKDGKMNNGMRLGSGFYLIKLVPEGNVSAMTSTKLAVK